MIRPRKHKNLTHKLLFSVINCQKLSKQMVFGPFMEFNLISLIDFLLPLSTEIKSYKNHLWLWISKYKRSFIDPWIHIGTNWPYRIVFLISLRTLFSLRKNMIPISWWLFFKEAVKFPLWIFLLHSILTHFLLLY